MNLDNLQRAIYAKLSNHQPLMDLIVSIEAVKLQEADSEDPSKFPYVVIGEDSGANANTKTDRGVLATCTIHIWTREGNLTLAKEIGHQIGLALDQQWLNITGANFISCDAAAEGYILDPDGVTQHGVATYNVLYDDI